MAKFKQGESGNPGGRPKGVRDKRTELRALLEPHAEKLVNKVVAMALKGDAAALRLCLERLVPALKTQERPLSLPAPKSTDTLADRGEQAIAALLAGHLLPDEASTVMSVLASQARIVETDDLARRVAALEEARKP